MAVKDKKGIWSNWIVRNLLLAFSVLVFLIVGAMIFLNVVTQHNDEISVPDFSNLSLAEAEELAASTGVRLDVIDSVFVKRMRKGAIYRQNPAPGSKVKNGRRIVLTINALNSKKVMMPTLLQSHSIACFTHLLIALRLSKLTWMTSGEILSYSPIMLKTYFSFAKVSRMLFNSLPTNNTASF